MHTWEAMHQIMKIAGANVIQIDPRKLRKEVKRDPDRTGRVSDKPRWKRNHDHLLISSTIPKHARETRTDHFVRVCVGRQKSIIGYESCRFTRKDSIHTTYPPRSPNSRAQSSYLRSPSGETLGLIEYKLASKSWNLMGRIWSMGVCRSASPRLRRGPMAASLARAVISEPEKPARSVRNA